MTFTFDASAPAIVPAPFFLNNAGQGYPGYWSAREAVEASITFGGEVLITEIGMEDLRALPNLAEAYASVGRSDEAREILREAYELESAGDVPADLIEGFRAACVAAERLI